MPITDDNRQQSARINEVGPLWRRRFGGQVRKLCLTLGTGCPNRDGTVARGGCIFCDAGPAREAPPLEQQLDRGIAKMARSKKKTNIIAYFQDHTATHLPAEALRDAVDQVTRRPQMRALFIGTRPDALSAPILDVLAHAAGKLYVLVELGLQTADDATLGLVGRAHTAGQFAAAVHGLHLRGLPVCAHVVLGLPTRGPGERLPPEGVQGAVATARFLADLRVEAVKLHHCHVLRGTPLAELFSAGRYTPPDLDGYLKRLVPFLRHLPATVEVHRLVGQAPWDRLVTPAFTADKPATLLKIRQFLQKQDVRQGADCSR